MYDVRDARCLICCQKLKAATEADWLLLSVRQPPPRLLSSFLHTLRKMKKDNKEIDHGEIPILGIEERTGD